MTGTIESESRRNYYIAWLCAMHELFIDISNIAEIKMLLENKGNFGYLCISLGTVTLRIDGEYRRSLRKLSTILLHCRYQLDGTTKRNGPPSSEVS
jgi:hypothetical protein